ncbi:MAG: aldo/keto reductase [Firmicutes bacterium]|jgi:predicted aldo/keto reductase-like oxidoreductase|nr:aldo/keto reductase [Bacillota bacterium]
MEYRTLGKTGIRVSRLCFGTLTLGPLQSNLPLEQGADLLVRAMDRGVTFFDTADLYGTYPYLREAMHKSGKRPVIASKSYDYTREGMKKSLRRALAELDIQSIDIFLLHEQESALTLAGHRPALEYLLEAKEQGLVRAVGFSTHHIAAVRAALTMPEIDVVHPLINMEGVGIVDGTAAEMLAVLGELHAQGVGIFAMKPLGGGHLIGKSEEAFRFVLAQTCLDAIAVGMQTEAEIDYNSALFSGEQPSQAQGEALRKSKRRLHVQYWCRGCGNCTGHCPQRALKVLAGKATVDEDACILCGYCGAYCPDFYLKIY